MDLLVCLLQSWGLNREAQHLGVPLIHLPTRSVIERMFAAACDAGGRGLAPGNTAVRTTWAFPPSGRLEVHTPGTGPVQEVLGERGTGSGGCPQE